MMFKARVGSVVARRMIGLPVALLAACSILLAGCSIEVDVNASEFDSASGARAEPRRSGATARPGDRAEIVRVLAFNIRYGTARDGLDHWTDADRRSKVVATMQDLDADIVGLQEAEAFQIEQLLLAMPHYVALGVHRDDGWAAGEGTAILVDTRRFIIAESGTFWMTETPTVPGSKSWDASLTRNCTFARLMERKTNRGLYIYNAHYDHRGQRSREESGRVIRAHIAARRAEWGFDEPVVLTGDLNAAEDNPAMAVIKGEPGEALQLVDSFRVLYPGVTVGTYTAFDPTNDGGNRKIDYVLCEPSWEVVGAGIDRRKIDGRYPSDHFPVWADLAWPTE